MPSSEYVYINPDVFASRLRRAMGKRKMTCRNLAENTGRTEMTVTCWRYGRQIPSTDIMIAIADTLNISLDYLCGRKEEMSI